MSRSRVLPLALAVCAAILVASGCAAGFEPYTTSTMKPRDGANYPDVGNESPVAVRHAYVLGPAPGGEPLAVDGDAAVYLNVINQTTESDRLVSASSPGADEVPVAADGEDGIELPAPPAGRGEADPVRIGQPPYSDNTVTLTGLTEELRSGSHVEVTFTFQRAGDITMQLPVVPRSEQRATLSPAPTESPSESPTETPTGTESPAETPTENG